MTAPEFGVLAYRGTNNVGDEIQSFAAARLLPHVDHYLDRDDLSGAGERIGRDVFAVLNGWYCQRPETWPPSPRIRPLLVSMHITRERVDSAFGLVPADYLTTPPVSDYLAAHGPVGARDEATLAVLQEAGIPSYFSGCLTLTLGRPAVPRDDDLIVLNDLPTGVVQHLRGVSGKQLFRTSHVDFAETDRAERFARAGELLALYARASCVVTARLHCALPCLAMGTPVLLIDVAADQYRFQGLGDLVHHCRADALLSGAFAYDVDAPPLNPRAHLPLREALTSRVAEFVAQAQEDRPIPSYRHPDPGERRQAILALYRRKGLPFPVFRARQPTFVKARPAPSASLPTDAKIAVGADALLNAELYSEHAGHLFGRRMHLNGRALGDQSWCIFPDHWELLENEAAA